MLNFNLQSVMSERGNQLYYFALNMHKACKYPEYQLCTDNPYVSFKALKAQEVCAYSSEVRNQELYGSQRARMSLDTLPSVYLYISLEIE